MTGQHRRSLHAVSADDDPVVAAVEMLRAQVRALETDVRQAGIPAPAPARNGNGLYLPRWAVGVVSSLVVAALIAITGLILDLRTDVHVIQGNRFTAVNGQEIRSDLYSLRAELMQRIADIDRRLERLERE